MLLLYFVSIEFSSRINSILVSYLANQLTKISIPLRNKSSCLPEGIVFESRCFLICVCFCTSMSKLNFCRKNLSKTARYISNNWLFYFSICYELSYFKLIPRSYLTKKNNKANFWIFLIIKNNITKG